MTACNEVEDHMGGVLNENDKVYWWSVCEDNCQYGSDCLDSQVEWRMEITAEDDSWGYDGINNYKHWYLHSWVENKPSLLIDTDCNDYCCPWVEPGRVDYEIRHPPNWDESDFLFDDPNPDGSKNDPTNYDIINTVIGAANTLSGSVIVSVGGAFVSAFIDTNSSSPVDMNEGYVDGTNRQRWTWEIDIDGDTAADIPDSPCNSASARFRIYNDMPANTKGEIDTWSRWNFSIPRFVDCMCVDAVHYGFTTDWSYNPGEFTSK